MPRYMSAREAADALDVTIQTLYAYVSRGMIRSEEADSGKRSRRYYAEDIERLIANKAAARNPVQAASEALHWGMPLLESGLTLITGDALYYRGQDVLELAESATFEQVAALLWEGDMKADVMGSGDHPGIARCLDLIHRMGPISLQIMQVGLAAASIEDVTAYDLSQAGVIRSGRRILHLLAAMMLQTPPGEQRIAQALAEHWYPDRPDAVRIINAALVLCADHELNPSSFTARVIAGAGASPYAVVSGALSAFQGVKHGGATERAGLFLEQIGEESRARLVIGDWLRRGETIPGFGHPLYPDGDPRGIKLLEMLAEAVPESPALGVVWAVSKLVERAPNIDAGLAAMAVSLGFTPTQAGLLFALSRTVGWIAHAIEQYGGRTIRPRARYAGLQPE